MLRSQGVRLIFIDAEVEGPQGNTRSVRFLVDSGATYSVLPAKVWRALRLKPKREMVFTLADGTEIRRKVSECLVRLNHDEGHTPVVLGEGSDEALLGVVTLENLGLVLNPFDRTLRPMRAMLAAVFEAERLIRQRIEGPVRRPRRRAEPDAP
jgi:clan AA aspartic protease